MKSYEIIERMSPGLANEVLGYLQDEQAPVFKSLVQALAEQRKLRPIFRISLTALWCTVSSEAQMTANSVVAVRCGRRDAVAKLIGNSWPHRDAIARGGLTMRSCLPMTA